jgi:pSer/pThr/pTyr-binding forkhead associated (FHA) protein
MGAMNQSEDRPCGRLLIQNGGFDGMTYELESEETIIGRNPTTDITLLDEGISREHALILRDLDSGEYVIEDLQSTNGTKVNGKRVRSATLEPGDQIEIGHTRFRFDADASGAGGT